MTCLPVGHGPAIGMTRLQLARELNAADWCESAGTSRRTLAENLSVLLCFLVPAGRRLPDGLRQALFAELKGGTLDVRQLDAVRWLEQSSLPVGQVTADVATRVLASAGVKLDGTPLSASKQGQRRTYLSKLLGYAVAQDLLPANPVRRVKRQTARKASTAVSKREIGSPELARTIIGAVADSMHRDFVKTVYLSGARPSEVAALRVTDCKLPDTGWGALFLRKSAAEASKSFTDGGNVRDDRGLKHRSEDEDREVPASPELVALLKARIGTAKRGIVFQNGAGGMASGSDPAKWCSEVNTQSRFALIPGVFRSDIGTGHSNTMLMVNGGCTSGQAVTARASTTGGMTDWYLPSEDELTVLYTTLLSTTNVSDYWSSTQVTDKDAVRRIASQEYAYWKVAEIYARFIRAF